MNNFQKIKSMSVDDLAEWMLTISNLDCYDCFRFDSGENCTYCKERHKQWLLAESEG